MSFPLERLDLSERVKNGLGKYNLVHAYRGSFSHGTFVPTTDPDSVDDIDSMAIAVPDEEYFLGLNEWAKNGTTEFMKLDPKTGQTWDTVTYEVRKAIRLLANGNPNVMSLLWVNENHYLHISEAGKLLLENRDLFSSKQLYKSFIGYAHGQVHRMTNFKKSGDTKGSRNKHMSAKRQELVDRFHYDTKHASHSVRLLRMGIEFLTDGKLYVHRSDAKELLEIKRGEWSLEQVTAETDRLFILAQEAYVRSTLPAEVDRNAINDLCIEIVRMQLESYK